MPNVFDGRAGFDVDVSYIFPQGVLSTTALIAGVAGVARVCTGCEADFLSAQRQGQGLLPSGWSGCPEGQA